MKTNITQIYQGESMGLVLHSDTPLDGWDVAAELFTSKVGCRIVCARPSREGMIPIEYKDQTLTIDIPASETAKLSEGSLYLHLTLTREDAVKKATIHLAEVLPASLIACRRTTVGQEIVFVENEIEMTIDMGASIPSDGDSAYELFQLHNPESTLTEQEYAQAPIVAAEVAAVAVRDMRGLEELVHTNEGTRQTAEQKRHTDTASAIERTDKAAEAAKAAAQSITDPLAILAHSDCTLEERIANLEQLLLDALSGKMYIPALKVQHFEAWGDVNLVLTGSGAPTRSPDKAGQFYVDTLNRVLYFATGNNAVLDWK